MKAGKEPAIYNKTMTNANTEYSQAIGEGVVKLSAKCRAFYPVKIAFKSGGSGTAYITIPAGGMWGEDNVSKIPSTLYFQCPTAAQVLEILAWEV